jgi:ribonuclease HI
MRGKGLTREQAAHLLAAGWRRDTLSTLNSAMRDYDADGAKIVANHLLAIKHETTLLAYRSYAPADIERVFAPPVDLCKPVIAYCDGSGNTSDKPAGIGVVVYGLDANPVFIAENIGLGTNNRAELCAAWRALRAVPDTAQCLVIRTDSEYTAGALTKDWARNSNAELIGNIRRDLSFRHGNVRFEHVDGHAGIEGNEVADKLANIGRKLITTVSMYEG